MPTQSATVVPTSYTLCEPRARSSTPLKSKFLDWARRTTSVEEEAPPIRTTYAKPELQSTNNKRALDAKYKWHKNLVLGIGAYGKVFAATSKQTGETVALKQMPKVMTDVRSFRNEMRVMKYIRDMGNHPHLCSLYEYFESPLNYYVILENIGGGELFDHLIQNGPYSEWDASRLIAEVAGALNFLHGIGVVHADLKPENILLTTPRRGDSVVKLADFGCAQLLEHVIKDNDKALRLGIEDDPSNYAPAYGAPTPAYCPPESLRGTHPIDPAVDMWALGVILFIMLTGAHPYDLDGEATNDEITERIQDTEHYVVPVYDPQLTGHLSESVKELISRLMDPNPKTRISALQTLEHPWIRGDTASTTVIKGSDARLSRIRKLRTKLQAKFFESAVKWSDDCYDPQNIAGFAKPDLLDHAVTQSHPHSLMERSFNAPSTKNILQTEAGTSINMSDFNSLLSDSIQQRHFPVGHVIYEEGSHGDHMYFIDSGSVQIETEDGSYAIRERGDFFGEGALLHSDGIRSATVKCLTPVHVLEISRQHFEKYIANCDSELLLTLKEKDNIRKRNRTKAILRQQKLSPIFVPFGKTFFQVGDPGNSLFVLESGKVDVQVEGHLVFSAFPGNVFGEHSVLTGSARNCLAKCVAKEGCLGKEITASYFEKLKETAPHVEETLLELHRRREFKKAVVMTLKKEFPYENPQEAFVAADHKHVGRLDKDDVAALMRRQNPSCTDEEIQEVLNSLDLTQSGTVSFDEFKKVFIVDPRMSSAM
eukprot:Nitzschia sp. Nitz4//scaffold99_size76975//9463//11760//NITZ4_005565-RA/size76975-processed-gene-0.43-mRNA-1//-1//CDS//3329560817//6557//frame0